MVKIKEFFKNKENLVLFVISAALTLNSLLLVIQKMSKAPLFGTLDYTKPAFVAYLLLSILVIATISFFNNKFDFKKIVEKIILVYLTTEIALIYKVDKFICYKDEKICSISSSVLPIVLVVYFILLGYLVFQYRKKLPSEKPEKFKVWFKKQGWLALSIVLAIFVLNIVFGSYHLAKKASVDEALWTFGRIPKFWNNIQDKEWHKTDVSDKPGITVALLSGIGLNWVNPKEYENIQLYDTGKNIEDMNIALRLPIFLFSALVLFLFYFFLEKLLGKKTALFSVILIGLSPILLGISTIINPDSLLWTLLPLSMLSYFVYKKENRHSYLFWAGIFLGLSLLTKYVSNILYVFFFLLIFSDYIFREKDPEPIVPYLKRSIIDYFSLLFFSLLTFLVLLPASWVKISKLLDGTILSQAFQKVSLLFVVIIALILADIFLFKGKTMSVILNFFSKYKKVIAIVIFSVFSISIIIAIANTYLGMKWFNFETILASPKSSYQTTELFGLFLANFYSLIFGIFPLALLALLFFSVKNIRQKLVIGTEEKIGIYLIFFILLYYFASAIDNVSATVRYQIVIYPIAFIIAAIGIKQFLDIKLVKKYVPFYLACFILAIFSFYSLNSIRPFYFSYASNLLPNKYVLNLKDMGDGSYEAAQYLNSLPDAEGLLVWTDKNGVCTFFVGSGCINSIGLAKNQKPIDYFVVSSGRESRTTKMILGRLNGGNSEILRLDKLYTDTRADFYLKIGGRPNNFVKVISAKSIE